MSLSLKNERICKGCYYYPSVTIILVTENVWNFQTYTTTSKSILFHVVEETERESLSVKG